MHTDFELTNLLPLYTSFVLFTHCFYTVIYALVKKLFVLFSLWFLFTICAMNESTYAALVIAILTAI